MKFCSVIRHTCTVHYFLVLLTLSCFILLHEVTFPYQGTSNTSQVLGSCHEVLVEVKDPNTLYKSVSLWAILLSRSGRLSPGKLKMLLALPLPCIPSVKSPLSCSGWNKQYNQNKQTWKLKPWCQTLRCKISEKEGRCLNFGWGWGAGGRGGGGGGGGGGGAHTFLKKMEVFYDVTPLSNGKYLPMFRNKMLFPSSGFRCSVPLRELQSSLFVEYLRCSFITVSA